LKKQERTSKVVAKFIITHGGKENSMNFTEFVIIGVGVLTMIGTGII